MRPTPGDLMRRISDYLHFLLWQTGLGYIALWALTLWTLGDGTSVFGQSGVCHPDEAKVLFYWVCNADSMWSILAMLSNTALTATVWAPVYVAAATVHADAIAIAAPILLTHVIGLPAALFVTIRSMLLLVQMPRNLFRKKGVEAPPADSVIVATPEPIRPMARVKARTTFGLRGAAT
jgi:hypothetical protein